MVINNKNIKEIYVNKVRPPKGAVCEHFYAVPNAEGYVLSDYGRLYRRSYTWTQKGGWNKVSIKMNTYLGCETYSIRFDDDNKNTEIPVHKLMAATFYPDLKNVYLYNFKRNPKWELRWSIYDLHVLTSQSEIAEALSAKMEKREPNYADERKHCTFANRFDNGKDFRKYINNARWGVISRGENKRLKELFPIYKNVTVSGEFRTSPTAFGQWFLDNYYFYPGAKLEIDKDLLGYGEANQYDRKYMCLLPPYLNTFFTRNGADYGYPIDQYKTGNYRVRGDSFRFEGSHPTNVYCDTFAEALATARNLKAEQIRKIVNKERSAGYIPEHILQAMEKWAVLCELGLASKWEPSAEKLIELRAI